MTARAASGLRQRQQSRRLRVTTVLVGLLVGSLAGCSSSSTAGPQPPQPPDQIGLRVLDPANRLPAPDLSGTTLSGRRFTLADHLNGKVVLVNVWASWCGPCRQEMPLLARAAATRRSNLLVVGIDERDREAAARSFAAAVGATYPSLFDPDGTLLNSLPLVPRTAVPSSLFIDSKGEVAAVVVGAVSRAQLDSVMAQLAKPA